MKKHNANIELDSSKNYSRSNRIGASVLAATIVFGAIGVAKSSEMVIDHINENIAESINDDLLSSKTD